MDSTNRQRVSLRGLSAQEHENYPDAQCVVQVDGRDLGGPITREHYEWWRKAVWDTGALIAPEAAEPRRNRTLVERGPA